MLSSLAGPARGKFFDGVIIARNSYFHNHLSSSAEITRCVNAGARRGRREKGAISCSVAPSRCFSIPAWLSTWTDAEPSAIRLRRSVRWSASGARHLDFLSPPRGRAGAPRISGFRTFGFSWILSSEISLFNGLHATQGRFFRQAALSRSMFRKGQPASIRRPTALKRLAGRKRRVKVGIMAADIARFDPALR